MSVFSLSNLKKTWYYLQKNGIRNAVWAVLERIGQEQEVYTWQEPDEKTLSFQREHSASLRISIVVPAYRTKKEHLEAMLNSVSKQSYPHWELSKLIHNPRRTVKPDLKHPLEHSDRCFVFFNDKLSCIYKVDIFVVLGSCSSRRYILITIHLLLDFFTVGRASAVLF